MSVFTSIANIKYIIQVNNGVMTGMIRLAGKKDVTVTGVCSNFNKPDKFVVDFNKLVLCKQIV